jgi:hypothetical protein
MERAWSFTASDGPGPNVIETDGILRKFFGYFASRHSVWAGPWNSFALGGSVVAARS